MQNSEEFPVMPSERQALMMQLLQTALHAVDPFTAVTGHLKVDGDRLIVNEQVYHLDDYDRIIVVGAGKASAPMVQAVETTLRGRPLSGQVTVKDGYVAKTERVTLHEASHPIPDERGVEGARKIRDLLETAGKRDLVIAVISGGGSALLTMPVEGVTLGDKQALTDLLLRSGATINEINTVRKHLSQMKGGKLARIAYPAPVIALIMSDVVGNPLDVISSGPTSPDPTTYAGALEVLRRYRLLDKAPASVREYLERGARGEVEETPKPGDAVFATVQNVVVSSNFQAGDAAKELASSWEFNTLLMTSLLQGEAREVARVISAIAKEVVRSGNPVMRPACLIFGGETTVTVHGSGKGGRATELALAAAIEIDGLMDTAILVAATDGTDGPTDAAGASITGETIHRARSLGLDPYSFLENNDSYTFFDRLGTLIKTGPTNTNVNDLIFVLLF